MKKKITLCSFFLFSSLFIFSQRTTITITDKNVTVASYTDKEIILNSASDLHLTASTKSLNNSIVRLNTENSWIFFDNIKPTVVIDSLLKYIYVNNLAAINKTNVRVAIYKHGTVVIPHSSSYKPLKVYTDRNLTGDSASYSLFTFNTALGGIVNNKIRSFKLKRGYMATLATAADGTGYSRVYVADDQDLEVPIMPNLLDKSISFVRVFNWEWVSKKGWCSSGSGWLKEIDLTNSTWYYSWSADKNSRSNQEYVPIRQNSGWPSWSEISGKQYVSHLLGFNEPDHVEQSNVTVAEAIKQWPEMLKSGLRVGSPAVTNNSWLYQFMDSCRARNYRVDYVAYHAYWGGKSPSNWYNDLKYIHEKTGRPIWLTEWNNGANWTTEGGWPNNTRPLLLTNGNAAKQLADLKGILQVLDTAHFIERYSLYNWVEDARAIILGDTLTLAGKYYAANKSTMAYNKVNEVIPTFKFTAPSLSITFGTNNVTLNVTDLNAECFNGFIVEKKLENGSFIQIFKYENVTFKKCTDTLDINLSSKVRYRIRTIFMDGTMSSYSNEVGYDVTNGKDIQYGNLSLSNVGWNPVLFNKPFDNVNNATIILGSLSNNNNYTLLTSRANLYSLSRFNLQLSPWAYQNVTAIASAESIPYFILKVGTYDFGGLKAIAERSTVGSTWTPVTFNASFDTIPVVFVSQIFASTTNATAVRIRNVTKTGFEARLQKESKISTKLNPEVISYFAITPGIGVIDDKKIIVGKTANNTVSTTATTTINYGDSISNPIFISQLQTCNDDTVTAVLRCLGISSKFATVVKQREKSLGITAASPESAGWLVINPVNLTPDAVIAPNVEEIGFYPNPVKDFIYLKRNNSDYLKVDILNIFGILVRTVDLNENKINLNDLSPGWYMLRALNHRSHKFIKL